MSESQPTRGLLKGGSGMAAGSISSHVADPRNFQRQTPRRKRGGSSAKGGRKENAGT
jgi:hypothetical protein